MSRRQTTAHHRPTKTTPVAPMAHPPDVTVTIRGVLYPLTACPATEGYFGLTTGTYSRPTQALAATLAQGESPYLNQQKAERVGTGYVHAVVEAVHSYQCAYVRMRKGKYGPCDCGAHQAMSGLLARGRP